MRNAAELGNLAGHPNKKPRRERLRLGLVLSSVRDVERVEVPVLRVAHGFRRAVPYGCTIGECCSWAREGF